MDSDDPQGRNSDGEHLVRCIEQTQKYLWDSFKAEKTICEVFAAHKEEIQSEVLAVDIKEGALEGYQKEWNINGHKVELGVEKQ